MKRKLLLRRIGRLLGGSLTGTLAVASAHAGIVTLDFNTDPTTSGKITSLVSSEPTSWRQDGGATGATGDGYLAVTDARRGQSTTIVFNDLEPGFLAASFIFECDLRMGGGHSNPADGFSVNYASAQDELVVAADAGSNPTGPWKEPTMKPAFPRKAPAPVLRSDSTPGKAPPSAASRTWSASAFALTARSSASSRCR